MKIRRNCREMDEIIDFRVLCILVFFFRISLCVLTVLSNFTQFESLTSCVWLVPICFSFSICLSFLSLVCFSFWCCVLYLLHLLLITFMFFVVFFKVFFCTPFKCIISLLCLQFVSLSGCSVSSVGLSVILLVSLRINPWGLCAWLAHSEILPWIM